MTLYRQLLLFTLLLFSLLFVGTWWVKLQSTRSFLLNQLESHAQDTATHLGLLSSDYMAKNDMVAIETMINAVFDRGYYRVIRLSDIDGNILIDRVLPVRVENVPRWFLRLVPLETPRAEALIMSNWLRAGSILVESHPGYAYQTLWQTSTRMSLWFALTCGFVSIGGAIGLAFLLRPLQRVELQAEALCNRRYEMQKRIPHTRELKRVVEAMNRMTLKVKEMFDQQAEVAEKMRGHFYRDELTGLGNRRYLEARVTAFFKTKRHGFRGAFLIIHLHDLAEINRQKGYKTGDELLTAIADMLRRVLAPHTDAVAARLDGGEFAVFLPGVIEDEARAVAEKIVEGFAAADIENIMISGNIGHVGGVIYDKAVTLGQLLAESDAALSAAHQNGPNQWLVLTLSAEGDIAPQGQHDWKELLSRVLREKRIVLYGQPVVFKDKREQLLHLEVFSRIMLDDDNMLYATAFMPLMERLRIVSDLDRLVLAKIVSLDTRGPGVNRFAVNISPTSLRDESFRNQTLSLLRRSRDCGIKIYFEFPEFNVLQDLETIKSFAEEVRELGHGIGLDHFGRSFSNFGYLQSLRPDYIKIDRAYTDELRDQNIDSQFFISTLCGVAHSLDINVVVEGVEDAEQWAALEKLSVDAVRGYLIGKPVPLENG